MFEPKGGRAQWEIVTDVLETKNIGDVVTYDEILEALGPEFPRSALSSVVWSAIRKFRNHKRTFENVRRVGWRMVEATEHSRLASKQQLRGKRRLADAVSIIDSTDLSKLDPEQRRVVQTQNIHFRRLLDQVSRRVDRIDKRVGMVEKDHVQTTDELDKLKDLLRRHGIHDGDE